MGGQVKDREATETAGHIVQRNRKGFRVFVEKAHCFWISVSRIRLENLKNSKWKQLNLLAAFFDGIF